MLQRLYIISIAYILDLLLGDPRFLYHPVQAIGFVISTCEGILWRAFKLSEQADADKNKKRVAGIFLTAIVIGISIAVAMIFLWAAYKINTYAGDAIAILICYQMLACKSLKDESMKVYAAISDSEASIVEARRAVSMIVGRDTDNLTREGVIKACVETIAENASDGVIAPLLYMMLFGPLGVVFYKAVNTMDSMVGYKNDRYRYFGTCSARLDDALNIIPSRISGILFIAAAYIIPGMDGKAAYKIFVRDRYCHKSPNSAQGESAVAGALGIRLAGPASYFGKIVEKPYIGDDTRTPEREDIVRANRLMMVSALLLMLLFWLCCIALL